MFSVPVFITPTKAIHVLGNNESDTINHPRVAGSRKSINTIEEEGKIDKLETFSLQRNNNSSLIHQN